MIKKEHSEENSTDDNLSDQSINIESVLRENTDNNIVYAIDTTSQKLVYLNPIFKTIFKNSLNDNITEIKDMIFSVHPQDRNNVLSFLMSPVICKKQAITLRILNDDESYKWIEIIESEKIQNNLKRSIKIGIVNELSNNSNKNDNQNFRIEDLQSLNKNTNSSILSNIKTNDGFISEKLDKVFTELKNSITDDVVEVGKSIKSLSTNLSAFEIERKQSEEKLRKNEEKYRGFIETTKDLITQVDNNGKFTFVNHVATKVFELEPEDCIGRNAFDFVHPEDREMTKNAFEQWKIEKPINFSYENRQISINDKVRNTIWTCTPVYDEHNELVLINGIARDITERKKAKEALKKSIQVSADIINKIPTGFFLYNYTIDNKLILLDANPEATKLTGIELEEWKGIEFDKIWPNAKPHGLTDKFKNVMKTGITYASEELFYEDNRLKSAYRVRAFKISRNRLAVAFEDISKRKKTEISLKNSEKRMALIFNSVSDNIVLSKVEENNIFRVMNVNPAMLATNGFTEEDVINKRVDKILSPDSYKKWLNMINKAIKTKQSVRYDRNEVVPNGNLVGETISTPIFDENDNCQYILSVSRDMSEQKKTEIELKKTLEELENIKNQLAEENKYLRDEINLSQGSDIIIGNDSAFRKVKEKVQQVSQTNATVLLTGETGVGKEIIARSIHESSKRKDKPFIKVNCASIARELFESEFFGHIKGSFTGAFANRIGRFELANGGTLFLDEIGEIPIELQSKLLRVLQESEFERIGDNKTRKVDVRIIAATNKNLEVMVFENKFRQDLYYRLSVFPIHIIPLRERITDIRLMADFFLKKSCCEMRKNKLQFTQEHYQILENYSWPGNVRELQNIIDRAVITSNNKELSIELVNINNSFELKRISQTENNTDNYQNSFPFNNDNGNGNHNSNGNEFHYMNNKVAKNNEMVQKEINNIKVALDRTGWKVFGPHGAAKLLGLPASTLYSKIKSFGIVRNEKRW